MSIIDGVHRETLCQATRNSSYQLVEDLDETDSIIEQAGGKMLSDTRQYLHKQGGRCCYTEGKLNPRAVHTLKM